ncbi:Stk1 family PASTA domain-containing Ser/Thr kinase [Kineosporia sp. J2-2]|uniref:non-specific serine/threonine protein kinase n=1 Tax=Kineosporia corallincola TaxID=2835133 RepID=A0ABS5TJC2_9ACTN|nr:Stk1 family PASTA domain-containing Ser/Thr kinase [Kineosporia corallincola]MBT0771199.1 Stk1 family PASTA domain-containing Ser/Thr kinase [Kineosporia corallincola]
MNDNVRVLGNRYEIGELLGRGGMAEVHAGRDARLGRTVAIKLLRTDLARDATFQARFRREAQSAAALNHPSIVAVYDTGEDTMVEASGAVVNLPYIVMEHIEGRTLREVLGEGHHLDVDAALEITTGVLTALEYSHRIGIVHRDIKPANVMLTPVGDVKVMDFGIARAMSDSSSTMTQTQAVIGTAQYLSPEQARGEQVDTRSDLYSAGCLLYELLTGRPPFMGDSPVSVAYQHVREQPIPPSHLVGGIPESVDRIVLHSLAKGRDERYQTAQDFRADVEAARGGQQIYAPMPAMTGSQATTQFMPAADGTRAMPPVPNAAQQGASLYGDQATTVGGQNQYDPYQQDQYGRRSHEPESDNRRPLVIGAAVLALIVVIAIILSQTVFGGGDDPSSNANGDGTTVSEITVPEVVGSAQAVAIKALTDRQFPEDNIKITKVETDNADEVGKVTKSDPGEGETVSTEDTITLTVGKNANTATVPDLSNMSVSEATQALEDEGLTASPQEITQSKSTSPGIVVSSDPASGESVKPGSSVSFKYTSSNVTMPDVSDMTYNKAKSALAAVGLKASRTYSETTALSPNTVIEAAYNVGDSVARGSTVGLTVAKAPTATETTEPSTDPTETVAPTTDPTATTDAPTATATDDSGDDDGGDDGEDDGLGGLG